MEILSRRQYTIYDYSVYNFAANIPLEGERRYFDTILTGITHPCSVMGDDVNQCDNLPFLEIVNIETAININIGILEISENRISIHNTGGGDITVTTGAGTFTLKSGAIRILKYSGAAWIRYPTFFDFLDSIEVTGNLAIQDTDFDEKYRIQGAHTITLPTVADNEGIELIFWNEGNHAAVIDGEGAETITFQHGGTATSVTFAKVCDWIRLKSDGSTWLCVGGYWGYTTGAAVTADGGGAYVDCTFNYTYWYENGLINFLGWGYIQVDNTAGWTIVDITSPITFVTVNFLLTTFNGVKAGADPTSLFDNLGSDSNIYTQARMTDSTSIKITQKRTAGNFTNGQRLAFSIKITGVV